MRRCISIIIGIASGIVLTYAWVKHVTHLIDTAEVELDPEFWIKTARIQAYDACYEGCSDCVDVEFAWKACRFTEKVNVAGVICDANRMWNWAERYPIECLRAAGEIYRADALAARKRSYRWQYAGVILTVGAGIVSGITAYRIGGWITAFRSTPYRNQTRPRRHTPRALGRRGSREALLGAAFLVGVISIIGSVHAKACMKYNPSVNLFFANEDGTLYGVIHGWLSNCYSYAYSCGEACSALDGNSKSCSAIYCTGTDTNTTPRDYVVAAAERVRLCGFKLVDAVPGIVGARIANPRIEMDLWVKVAVNRFNLTDHTDPSIMCLYDMVKG